MISADSRSAFCTRHRAHFVAGGAAAGRLDRRPGCVTIVRQSARRKRAFDCHDAIARMAHPDAPSGRGACGDFAISVVRRRRNAMPAMARLFSDTVFWGARVQGCDASHRARILDTHLTHGCIQLFRRFSSGGSDGASDCAFEKAGIQPFSKTPHRRPGREWR